MHHTLPTSNYSHGSIETRDQSQPHPLYRELTSMLTGPIASQEGYWKTHGLILEEGRVQLVEHPSDDLELIGDVCREALWSSELSFKEKAQLALSAKKLFAERGLTFTGEPTLTLAAHQSDGTVALFTLTLSESSRSDFFKKFWTSDYQESKKAQKNEAIQFDLPDGITAEDFFNFIHIDDLGTLTLDKLYSVILLSEYVQDIDKAHRCLDLFPSLLPSDQTDLESLLIELPILLMPELQNHCLSLIMQKYIEVRMEEGASIQDIAETIERSPELKEALSDVSLDLKLGNFVSSSTELVLLASVIPNLRSLDLSYSNIDSLPLVWEHSLLNLNISHTKHIARIPHGFTHLQSFSARYCENLEDISTLNGSEFLKDIDISWTAVTSAPYDCPALERFYARSARSLSDISGLNGSRFLKEIDVNSTAITSAPQGCTALERFNARTALQLNDISGLNGSRALKEIRLSSPAITSAPQGCTALEIFDAAVSFNLNDISGLTGSRTLKEIIVAFSAITSAPHDCPALERFDAEGANSLSDISGLSGSQFLKEIDVTDTAVTSAPHGCPALERFDANSAHSLNDISGLSDSRALKYIFVRNTAVTTIPNNVRAETILR